MNGEEQYNKGQDIDVTWIDLNSNLCIKDVVQCDKDIGLHEDESMIKDVRWLWSNDNDIMTTDDDMTKTDFGSNNIVINACTCIDNDVTCIYMNVNNDVTSTCNCLVYDATLMYYDTSDVKNACSDLNSDIVNKCSALNDDVTDKCSALNDDVTDECGTLDGDVTYTM